MNINISVVIIAGFALLIALYNFIRHSVWHSSLPERGKIITVNRQDIFAAVRGTGKPAVIFLTASGSVSAEWEKIQEELSRKTTVLIYDRPGYGYSGPHKTKRTAENITAELMALLKELKIPGPYILAGHGLGGLYAQYFCRKYPKAIKAAVLIDSLSPDHSEIRAVSKHMKYFSADGKMTKIHGMMPMAALGTLRLLKFYFAPMILFFHRNAGQNAKKIILESYLWHDIYRASVEEMKNIDRDSADLNKPGPFPKIPLRILFHNPLSDIKEMIAWQTPANDADAIEEKWREIDRRFPGLSGDSSRTESEKLCGHMVNLDDPDLIIRTIKQLL